jgi:hypothetical protein
MACFVKCVRENRNSCRILLEKLEGKRSLETSRCRNEDNIKFNLKEIRWEG